MNKYVPKVGDKVRATLGESVIVGTVDFRSNAGDQTVVLHGISGPHPTIDRVWLWDKDNWQFEQVVSVPTKFGAVIRRADGRAHALVDPKAADGLPWVWSSPDTEWDSWATTEEATAGGFTVLFEGVDE